MNRTQYEGLYALQPPKYIREIILRHGGINPHGEPNFRLVRTEARTRRVWGYWTDWAPGTPMNMRNVVFNRPLRTVVEWRRVPLYPGEHGWAIERWFPPEMYGSKHKWFQIEELGGTLRFIDGVEMPMYGGYPSMGDYETCNYVLPDVAVTERVVGSIVSRFQRALEDVRRSKAERFRQEFNAQIDEEAQQQASFDKFADEQLGEALAETPSLDSWSLGGQAEMHRFAEKVGIKSQLF